MTASPFHHSPLLVIVGQTACGKSALALELAQRLNGEIICADSWTVRRRVDIGTAKPSAADQALVKHHLLDIIEPDEDFTAAVFKDMAQKVIQDVIERGKLPILVGGTGLYIDSVLYDYGFLPAGNRQEREKLNALNISELLELIADQGFSLKGVDQRNKRRLIRLLESNGREPEKHELRHDTFIIGLTHDRDELIKRITARIDMMIQAGLEQEVQGLVSRYGWGCEALKGIGYREWQEYFNGSQTLLETRQRIIKASLDLAKRQRTWFKRNKSIHWLLIPVNVTALVDLVTTNLNK